jgi:hypothetical protein
VAQLRGGAVVCFGFMMRIVVRKPGLFIFINVIIITYAYYRENIGTEMTEEV